MVKSKGTKGGGAVGPCVCHDGAVPGITIPFQASMSCSQDSSGIGGAKRFVLSSTSLIDRWKNLRYVTSFHSALRCCITSTATAPAATCLTAGIWRGSTHDVCAVLWSTKYERPSEVKRCSQPTGSSWSCSCRAKENVVVAARCRGASTSWG